MMSNVVYVLYSSWPTYSSDQDYMFNQCVVGFVQEEDKAQQWVSKACKPEEDRWYEEVEEYADD